MFWHLPSDNKAPGDTEPVCGVNTDNKCPTHLLTYNYSYSSVLFQFREQMLTKMATVLMDSPSNTTHEVQVTARAVAGLTQRTEELSPAAQVGVLYPF